MLLLEDVRVSVLSLNLFCLFLDKRKQAEVGDLLEPARDLEPAEWTSKKASDSVLAKCVSTERHHWLDGVAILSVANRATLRTKLIHNSNLNRFVSAFKLPSYQSDSDIQPIQFPNNQTWKTASLTLKKMAQYIEPKKSMESMMDSTKY